MVTYVEHGKMILLMEDRLALPGVGNCLMFLSKKEASEDHDQPWCIK